MPVIIEMTVSESTDPEEGDIPDTDELQLWADKALMRDDEVVASLQIVGSNEMRELNNTWRGRDKSTNVLSFPMEIPSDMPDIPEMNILGDIVFCPDVINAEAEQQHITKQAHWAHMVVHGMLHLQGYDHIEEKQAEEMESLEIQILNQLGFANPYEEQH